jgi:hypothetical protein
MPDVMHEADKSGPQGSVQFTRDEARRVAANIAKLKKTRPPEDGLREE